MFRAASPLLLSVIVGLLLGLCIGWGQSGPNIILLLGSMQTSRAMNGVAGEWFYTPCRDAPDIEQILLNQHWDVRDIMVSMIDDTCAILAVRPSLTT